MTKTSQIRAELIGARKVNGWTQQGASEFIGCGYSTLRAWEQGDSWPRTAELLDRWYFVVTSRPDEWAEGDDER